MHGGTNRRTTSIREERRAQNNKPSVLVFHTSNNRMNRDTIKHKELLNQLFFFPKHTDYIINPERAGTQYKTPNKYKTRK